MELDGGAAFDLFLISINISQRNFVQSQHQTIIP
jgi:hypothetical protein